MFLSMKIPLVKIRRGGASRCQTNFNLLPDCADTQPMPCAISKAVINANASDIDRYPDK